LQGCRAFSQQQTLQLTFSKESVQHGVHMAFIFGREFFPLARFFEPSLIYNSKILAGFVNRLFLYFLITLIITMSTKYKVKDQEKLHFITTTVIGWVDIFARPSLKHVIIDSLDYCQKIKD
jgi:hypothetical protein